MSLNASNERLINSDCNGFFRRSSNGVNSNSTYYKITFSTCVITAALSPMAVVANSVIFVVLWRNPSFKTPSYVILGCLAFTDFCTGLVSQPCYVVYKLGQLIGNKDMFCTPGSITETVAPFFSAVTVIAIALMAVERWLYMSRRSLLTARRILTIFILLVLVLALGFAIRHYNLLEHVHDVLYIVEIIFIAMGSVVFVVTAFSYYRVFCIIRRHQMEVQTGQTAIDVAKYRKSYFTILYIMLLFLLSYVPYVICMMVFKILKDGGLHMEAQFNACTVVVFTSSFLNPLLYCWRIREIRNDAKILVKKLFRKE